MVPGDGNARPSLAGYELDGLAVLIDLERSHPLCRGSQVVGDVARPKNVLEKDKNVRQGLNDY